MKEVGFTRRGHLFGFGAKEEEAKFFVICCFFIFVGVVCISVLDKLQYLVALEGKMLECVDGCIFKG
jgi:hypothetical protein